MIRRIWPAARPLILPSAGGLLVASILGGVVLYLSSPFQFIARDRLVVFVSEKCGVSKWLVDEIEKSSNLTEIGLLVVPISSEATPWRDGLCRRTLGDLRNGGTWWLSLVPDDVACRRLAEDAVMWWHDNADGATPVWGRGRQLIGSGVSATEMRKLGIDHVLPGREPPVPATEPLSSQPYGAELYPSGSGMHTVPPSI